MNDTVGRIVDLECHRPPPAPMCSRCIMLENAIKEHRRKIDTAYSFRDESIANLELWETVAPVDA